MFSRKEKLEYKRPFNFDSLPIEDKIQALKEMGLKVIPTVPGFYAIWYIQDGDNKGQLGIFEHGFIFEDILRSIFELGRLETKLKNERNAG